jgi:hypothetical protein
MFDSVNFYEVYRSKNIVVLVPRVVHNVGCCDVELTFDLVNACMCWAKVCLTGLQLRTTFGKGVSQWLLFTDKSQVESCAGALYSI